MAVIPNRPGLDVCVLVDGKSCKEYRDPDYSPPLAFPEIEKYIEAKTDSKFALAITMKDKCELFNRAIRYNINIDGIEMTSRTYKTPPKRWIEEGVVYSKQDSMVALRRYMFSQLEIVEEDSGSRITEATVKSLAATGTITIRFWPVKIQSYRPWTGNECQNLNEIGRVPEKALKGREVSHKAGLGPAEDGMPFTHWCQAQDDGPVFAIFKFKYRSLRALKSLGLVQRTPSPEPLERRPLESLTRDEAIELLRRRQEAAGSRQESPDEALIRKIKREREEEISTKFYTGELDGDNDDCSFVEARPAKRLRTDVEIID